MPAKKNAAAAKNHLPAVPTSWLRTVPTPIFILDRKGKISYGNDAFVELTGYNRSELIGAGTDVLFDHQRLKDAIGDFLELYSGRGLVGAAYAWRRKTGTAIRVIVNITPVYGDPANAEIVTNAVGIVLKSSPA